MSYRPPNQTNGITESLTNTAPEALSLIDRHSSIEGTFSTQRDLRIEGEMRGNLQCQGLLSIAEGAEVDATVEAANVVVAGSLKGTVNCRGKLQIMSTGRVSATVTTDSLVIDEGAFFEGELRMEMGRSSESQATVTSGNEERDTPTVLRRFTSDSSGSPPAPSPSPSAPRSKED